jgi:glycosyltransferase involved in cell wall biosynthesis
MNLMLAIVIPYFKPDFFESTIASLANQTDKRFKIYVGNDASKSSPRPLLEKYKAYLDFYYKEFEENMGGKSLVKQWERCLALTKDEGWVVILGDDDVIGEDFVASFYQHLPIIEYQGNEVIRYATVVIDQAGNAISKTYVHPVQETAQDFIVRRIQGQTRSSLSEYIFKKETLFKIGFRELPLAWYSDILAVFEIAIGKGIYTINESKVFFRSSGHNISSRTDNQALKTQASFKFMHYLLEKWGKSFNDQQKETLLNRFEKTFFNNKKNLYFWKQFSAYYLKNLYFRRYIFFGVGILKVMIKKK